MALLIKSPTTEEYTIEKFYNEFSLYCKTKYNKDINKDEFFKKYEYSDKYWNWVRRSKKTDNITYKKKLSDILKKTLIKKCFLEITYKSDECVKIIIHEFDLNFKNIKNVIHKYRPIYVEVHNNGKFISLKLITNNDIINMNILSHKHFEIKVETEFIGDLEQYKE